MRSHSLLQPTLLTICLFLVIACETGDEPSSDSTTLFRYLPSSSSGIRFSNDLAYDEQINPYTFRNFFNGAGVGIGDLNNDGWADVILAGNQVPNRIFLNKGNLTFSDITESSGLSTETTWTTGISLADVNQDGWLDIYLCKSGPPGGNRRKNELFINQQNLTFHESAAEYGLDFEGLATQAVFFDYDLDGDPDCYLLNNSYRPVGVFDYVKDQRNIPDPDGGNRLLRNDNGRFVDFTATAGIYSSAIGFGLGVAVGDVNDDGWPDMFVSNDFFERDYLYINQQNGTFKESLVEYMDEISLGSMGADIADLTNDGLPEIFVTEMLPEHDQRLKTNGQFENWNRYQQAVNAGYHRQFGRNVLQLNNGDGTFSEIGRYAGVEATDWSWGALIMDMDNDGLKDIFVANGIHKDLLDQDYVTYIANPDFIRRQIKERGKVIQQLVDSIPSKRLPNYAFRNNGDNTFTNMSEEWGLGLPTHSNGSAFGDLDNDGDLDLIINNINQQAAVYENRSRQLLPENHSVTIDLRLKKGGPHAFGSKATVWINGIPRMQELAPMRGFMSVVDARMVIGTGKSKQIDSIVVKWPRGLVTKLGPISADTSVTMFQSEANPRSYPTAPKVKPLLRDVTERSGLDFKHQENDYVDFDRDRLLFNMISNEGPCLCSGDANGDGLSDLYVGGAKGQSGALFVQQRDGRFRQSEEKIWQQDLESEDTDCVFADFNGDGRQDLYVASGGVEFSSSSSALLDRLYFNTGGGRFKKSDQILPAQRFESTAVVRAKDFDEDGDQDLFAGIRSIPFEYGVPSNGYILRNDGKGNLSDVTREVAPSLTGIGMITDAVWTDLNRDGYQDLVIVGDWMGIRVLINENGRFDDQSESWGMKFTNGWYSALIAEDLNGDSYPDIVAGNHGLNSRFRTRSGEPIELYVNDFDNNGDVEHILTRYDEGKSYPLVLRNDLVSQLPVLKRRLLYFRNYSQKKLTDIFPNDLIKSSIHLQASTLETSLWLNNSGKGMTRSKLPAETQFTPVHAMISADFNGDKKPDLLLGGNQYRAKPETGIYAAGHGLLLVGDGTGNFAPAKSSLSGILLRGEIRSFQMLGRRLAVGMNNDKIRLFEMTR